MAGAGEEGVDDSPSRGICCSVSVLGLRVLLEEIGPKNRVCLEATEARPRKFEGAALSRDVCEEGVSGMEKWGRRKDEGTKIQVCFYSVEFVLVSSVARPRLEHDACRACRAQPTAASLKGASAWIFMQEARKQSKMIPRASLPGKKRHGHTQKKERQRWLTNHWTDCLRLRQSSTLTLPLRL